MLRASLTVLLAALVLSGSGASAGRRADPPTAQGRPTFFISGHGYSGSVRILKVGSKVRVVNVVDLDLYLRGVVPSEMPKDWAPEALKAQAVAALSYALSHLHPGGGYDLYPDTRDQVYRGIPHEAPTTTAAVNATA